MKKEKDKGGRPALFNSPEELQKAIDRYFENPPLRIASTGGVAIEVPFVSVTGLVLACGFADRQSFYDYEKREGYSCIIKRARLMVENEYEYMLQKGQPTGAIFALKNMGWSDGQSATPSDSKPIQISIVNPYGTDKPD